MSLSPAELPDQGPRSRIRSDFETNFLVEAGAGSGKTTELMHRMVGLIRTGTADPEELAAVTFTRKAAGELRERFQEAMETAVARAEDPEEKARLRDALQEVDRSFVGTIHGFCARLLREHPLEARLDPGFRELQEEEARRLAGRFWRGYLERLAAEEDPLLDRLSEAGLEPGSAEGAFLELSEHPDVDWPAPEAERPPPAEIAPVRAAMEDLLDRARNARPAEEPPNGWDDFQKKLPYLLFCRGVREWDSDPVFFDALGQLLRARGHGVTLNRWPDEGRARALREDLEAFKAEESPARDLLRRWWAYRYHLVVELASGAAREYARHRRRTGALTFQDLLLHAARLLRESPGARRALGERYRYLMVDEFQDTDPLQAEIILLLTSPPEDDPGEGALWRRVSPRPGALFVVGDPKQSIYRFRRADIAVYDSVKERFREFGDVLELTANFRSRAPIADLVNHVFQDPERFPPEGSPYQAAFAPLIPQEPGEGPVREGVFWYPVAAPRNAREAVARVDAALVASWIRERTGPDGDREPRDFLVLTATRKELEAYARELEARRVPVQVTGSGVGVEEELRELRLLLQCLSDPDDPVLTAAVLVGPFFGLDHEALATHRDEGGSFSLMQPGESQPAGPVREALRRLSGWWGWSREEPADLVVERITEEVGLIPWAASGELGQVRAGALSFALESLRRAALEGRTSLADALDTLEESLDAPEAEAPLQPGRTDVVRVMNLHKAKGLEAPVVILACPGGAGYQHRVTRHIEREEEGRGVGHLVVQERQGWSVLVHAREMEWPQWDAEESRFEEAEEVRELYVAATRAAHELVVARNPDSPAKSPWSVFDSWLQEHGTELDIEIQPPPEPRAATESAPEIRDRIRAVEKDRALRARPSYRIESVTARAKAPVDPASQQIALELAPDGQEAAAGPSRGIPWGLAVHGALAAAARGTRGEALRRTCRALLVDQHRPLDSRGEPKEMAELVELVEGIRGSELWRRAGDAEQVLVEAPFAVRMDDGENEIPEVVEGIVDLAFHDRDGWVIVDYKTDVGGDPRFEDRKRAYRRQVDLYARAWELLTGEPVVERVLFYTARPGASERW